MSLACRMREGGCHCCHRLREEPPQKVNPESSASSTTALGGRRREVAMDSGSVQRLHRATGLCDRRHTQHCPQISTMCCRASFQL